MKHHLGAQQPSALRKHSGGKKKRLRQYTYSKSTRKFKSAITLIRAHIILQTQITYALFPGCRFSDTSGACILFNIHFGEGYGHGFGKFFIAFSLHLSLFAPIVILWIRIAVIKHRIIMSITEPTEPNTRP